MVKQTEGHVQVLSKALSILDIIGQSSTPLSLTQITKQSGISKTTAYRLLKTLVAHGYLTSDRHTEYALGPQIVCHGAKALHASVATVGQAVARNLFEATSQTVCICALSGFEIVYLLKLAPTITIKQNVGSTRPAYGTALGKCQLAYLPDEELDRLISLHGLPRMTENTICDVEAFKEDLASSRRAGFSVNNCEANPRVSGVAAPIFDYAGKCVAAISVAILHLTGNEADILAYAEPVVEAAAAISSLMGYSVTERQRV